MRSFAAAVIAALPRRPSRNRNSWATVKNCGWPESDGVSGTRDTPPAPWQARHTVMRSSSEAASAGDAASTDHAAVRTANAARAMTRVESGRAALDPALDGRVNASS